MYRFNIPWPDAIRNAGYNWVTAQKLMTQKDTRQTPHHRCSIAEPLSQYDDGSAPPRNFGSRSTKGPGKTCKK